MKLFQPQWNFSYHSETNSTAKVSLWFLQMENWGGLSPPIRTFAELIMTQWNLSIMPKGQKPYTTTPFWYRKSTMVSYQNHRADMAEAVGFEPTRRCRLPDFESGPLWPLRYTSVSNFLIISAEREKIKDYLSSEPAPKPFSNPGRCRCNFPGSEAADRQSSPWSPLLYTGNFPRTHLPGHTGGSNRTCS